MIQLYSSDEGNFSANGLRLDPLTCIVRETINGMYELQMEYPIVAGGHWQYITNGSIVKAPVPVRTTPTVSGTPATGTTYYGTTTSTGLYSTRQYNEIYPEWNEFGTYSSGALVKYNGLCWIFTASYTMVHTAPPGTADYWERHPPASYLIKSLKSGVVFAALEVGTSWVKARLSDGQEGYIPRNDCTYGYTDTKDQETVYSHQIREQLFRVYDTKRDLDSMTLTVNAQHIFYDLLRNLTMEYNTNEQEVPIAEAGAAIISGTIRPNSFNFYCTSNAACSGEWVRQSPVNILLDPDTGMLAGKPLTLLRDNFDIYVMDDREQSTGISLDYGKNLLGITYAVNSEDVVTRIVPVGKTSGGDDLLLPEVSVVSPRENDYPTPRIISVDVPDAKVSDELTEEQALEKMRDYCEDQFSSGVDLPKVTINVDFVLLGNTRQYQQYRDLELLFLGDIIPIHVPPLGIDTESIVSAYEFDCINERYSGITLGEESTNQTIPGYQLSTGSVTPRIISRGAVTASGLASGSVGADKILAGSVTTDKLIANAVTANKIAPIDGTLQVTSGGKLNFQSGSDFEIQSGGKFTVDADDDDSYIRFGGTPEDPHFMLGKSGNVLAKEGFFDSLYVKNGVMWTESNMVVQDTKPVGHEIVWIKPTTGSASRMYSGIASGQFGGYSDTKTYTVNPESADVLGGTQFSYAITLRIYNWNQRRTGVRVTVVASKGGQSVTLYNQSGLSVNVGDYIRIDTTNNRVTSAVNLCGDSTPITISVTVSKDDTSSSMKLENSDTSYLTVNSNAGSGVVGCEIFYVE